MHGVKISPRMIGALCVTVMHDMGRSEIAVVVHVNSVNHRAVYTCLFQS